ncbi:hypothetical protein UGMREWDR_CDS0263 [Aeromonas phage GomatiRiver_11]|nr:hypothetical protein OBDJBBDK_00258 [Aeromonas phage AhFM11]WKW84422.1 hypothetical protein UGMREWDR_CDS0263 [Aeromonas phage GomatiRiver_11]
MSNFGIPQDQEVCVVCKLLVPKSLAQHTSHGPTHPGPCAAYAQTLPITESAEALNETELLM